MQNRARKYLALLFCISCAKAYSKDITIDRSYLDRNKSVHIVTAQKQDIPIARYRNCRDPEISEDRRTVASICDVAEDGNVLVLYRNGKTRLIKGDPFVREFRFIDRGEKLAVDIGGLHFAGHEFLYDVFTLKKLDDFSQSNVPLEKRPAWSTDKK
jgi:hypothetical protein